LIRRSVGRNGPYSTSSRWFEPPLSSIPFAPAAMRASTTRQSASGEVAGIIGSRIFALQ
jgi:hypothetical protein